MHLSTLDEAMGKAKAKGRRGRDDDDFECAVQALETDTPAAQPQQADEESSELDELLERALALCLLSEASYDELTDELWGQGRTITDPTRLRCIRSSIGPRRGIPGT